MGLLDKIRNATRSGATGWPPYLVACLFVLGCLLIWTALGPALAGRSPLLPFVAAVVLVSGLYGVGPGLAAIGLSLVLALSIFAAPATRASLGPDYIPSVAVFIVTSAATLIFADHLRNARRRALLLEGELQQVQTAAAMSTMAGTLAHELNQPLAAASNYVAACRQLTGTIEEERGRPLVRALTQAEEQIQRAGAIIREARTLVRNVPVERRQSWLKPLINRVIEVARANEARGRVRFEVVIGPGAARARVNHVQVEQVLLNLVRNACQAMTAAENPAIFFQTRRAEGGTLIEVRDNGPGIAPDRLPALFSTARGSSGTGLGVGLSMCRTLIEAHGGSIMAQNHPEGGADFLILLPDERTS